MSMVSPAVRSLRGYPYLLLIAVSIVCIALLVDASVYDSRSYPLGGGPFIIERDLHFQWEHNLAYGIALLLPVLGFHFSKTESELSGKGFWRTGYFILYLVVGVLLMIVSLFSSTVRSK